MLKLVESVNEAATKHDKGRRQDDLKEAFELLWPKLEETIKKLREQGPPSATASSKRTAEDMMAEVLTTIREVAQQNMVIYNRQDKMLLLAKQQYEEAVGRIAPPLTDLRKWATVAPVLTNDEARSFYSLLKALDAKVSEDVKVGDIAIKQPKATETDS